MPIRRLPSLLVNQIAAGEVIERPASVVKELLENAIDAGAGRIEVAIEQGGCELIRITDDGSGIAPDELPLALAAHATSKIAEAADLDAIATMGFRGEALASIASVSRITILSRTPDQPGAMRIDAEGDTTSEPRPASGPPGTTITVRNLFFNTPARRKFLRTEQTEGSRSLDVVRNLALAHPSIGFTARSDDQLRLELAPNQSPRERVLAVLGVELEEELLELSANERGIGIWGLAGTPTIARGTAKHQRIYLNGRMIQDRSIYHAIKEAYRGLIEPTRSPTIALFLQIDPALVDVNVHPAKAEVRFRNQASMHGVVLHAIRAALRAADLTPSFHFAGTGSAAAGAGLAVPPMPLPEFTAGRVDEQDSSMGDEGCYGSRDAAQGANSGGAGFVDYFRRLDSQQKGFIYSEVKQVLAQEAPEFLHASEDGAARDASRAGEISEGVGVIPSIRAALSALQVHSSYIVTQDADGMVIIDQHALHERVMFEKLRERVERGTLEAQRLLMPASVPLERGWEEIVDSLKPLFAKLGIEAELIGPRTLGVHAFTSLLFERGVDPVTFMQELLEKSAEQRLADDPEAALHEVLDMMACKAAIKAGDRLTPQEIDELLKYRATVERSSNCPHGRPTSLRLSIRDLEKQFGRR